jgi:hypothetical protein
MRHGGRTILRVLISLLFSHVDCGLLLKKEKQKVVGDFRYS